MLTRLYAIVSYISMLILITACGIEASLCNLPCELEIDQTSSLTVQEFLEQMKEYQWINEEASVHLSPSYAPDLFSNVLETTVTIDINRSIFTDYTYSEITLYISNIGSATELDEALIPSANIENININTDMTILQSLLIFGIPEGGEILPFYTTEYFSETNPCQDFSLYVAYYDGGRTVVRSLIQRPFITNIWKSQVQIMYPIDQELEFISNTWIGRYMPINHQPCRLSP